MGESLIGRAAGDLNELLDIAQAAALLNVSETSLRRWTNSGQLRCLRIGRRRERRFRREDLLAFLENQPAGKGATVDGALGRTSSESETLTLTQRAHLCAVYSSDLARISLAVPFLIDGLRAGSGCVLVAPPRMCAKIFKSLETKRPFLRTDILAGRLVGCAYRSTGRAQLAYYRALLDSWVGEGLESFRIFGDLGGLRSRVSAQALMDYESGYDRIIARNYPVVTMCAYDARKFSGIDILNALKGHPDSFRGPLERTLA